MAKRGEFFWGICKVQSILAGSLCRNRSSCAATRFSNDRQGREVISATRIVSTTMGRPAYNPNNNTLGLRLFSSSNRSSKKLEQPIPATTSKQTISTWVNWIMGSLLSFLIPFWTHKYWRNLQMIEGEAELVLKEVDNAAKMVERAATMAEKVSADVADKLPTHTKLKEIALLIERVSKLAAQDAQLTHQFVHKVDALKDDLEDLEKLLKPAIDKIENYEHQRQLTSSSQIEQKK